jgi:hypothetical protein
MLVYAFRKAPGRFQVSENLMYNSKVIVYNLTLIEEEGHVQKMEV